MKALNKVQSGSPLATGAAPGLSRRVLYAASGAAALAAGALLLAALIDFTVTSLRPDLAGGWLSLLGNNWLVIILELHAGVGGVTPAQLYTLNFLDMAILALVAITFLGLYAALHKASRVWSPVAAALPILGMALFIATASAGRSAVMGAVLVISLVMLRDNTFGKAAAYTGTLASVLLLIGDVSVGFDSAGMIAVLVGAGYVLLAAWLFLAARALFRRAQGAPIEGVSPR